MIAHGKLPSAAGAAVENAHADARRTLRGDQMSLEQIALHICRINGIDYHALSDSKKQTFLSQACKVLMLQTPTKAGDLSRS